ncbi:hypothetical protein HDU93_000844 [Gonapodya sp. JEL0774]|nr:hypothetical protein HDU93_000844 [Gonapodya sp. JEL0774]
MPRFFKNITATNGYLQFFSRDGKTMMLPSDIALVQSNTFRYYVFQYAANSTIVYEKFASSWQKLMDLGYSSVNLTTLPVSTDPSDGATDVSVELGPSWSTISLGTSMQLSWQIRLSDGFVDFKVACRYTGWFAIGFGESMIDMDIVAYIKTSNTVQDLHSSGYQLPQFDAVQNLADIEDATPEFPGFIKAVAFSRQLSTGGTKQRSRINARKSIVVTFFLV